MRAIAMRVRRGLIVKAYLPEGVCECDMIHLRQHWVRGYLVAPWGYEALQS